jgi:hypothetical protein
MPPRPKLDLDSEGLRITYPEFGSQAELKWAEVTSFEVSCVSTPDGPVQIYSLVHDNGEALELNDDIPKFDRRIDEIAVYLSISPTDLAKLRGTKSRQVNSIKTK